MYNMYKVMVVTCLSLMVVLLVLLLIERVSTLSLRCENIDKHISEFLTRDDLNTWYVEKVQSVS